MRQGKCPYNSFLSRKNNDLYIDGQNTRQTVTSTTVDTHINYCYSTYQSGYNYQFICVSLPVECKPYIA